MTIFVIVRVRLRLNLEDKCDKERCYHRTCCLKNGYNGCWECPSFPCDQGRFVDENRGQALGFLQYIKDFGKTVL
ncbi:DUF3795 domain-containing protein [Lucifera butyrica]|uniref:DUF3795 domain-containing protein n=1 Tax=Lucifera butyrica TaxID=1351585 RepID=UPI000F037EF7